MKGYREHLGGYEGFTAGWCLSVCLCIRVCPLSVQYKRFFWSVRFFSAWHSYMAQAGCTSDSQQWFYLVRGKHGDIFINFLFMFFNWEIRRWRGRSYATLKNLLFQVANQARGCLVGGAPTEEKNSRNEDFGRIEIYLNIFLGSGGLLCWLLGGRAVFCTASLLWKPSRFPNNDLSW